MEDFLSKLLSLTHISENLKREKRHSWLSNGDHESVAEHSYRMALMVYLIAPKLEFTVNTEKVLKMALIHDLVEAYTGDCPDFEVKSAEQVNSKFLAEEQAIEKAGELLGLQELPALWHEFERGETREAQLVRAIDRLEMQVQHNEADLSSWSEIEKKRMFLGQLDYCRHDAVLLDFATRIRQESIDKLEAGGEDVSALERWVEENGREACSQDVGLKAFAQSYEQSETANR